MIKFRLKLIQGLKCGFISAVILSFFRRSSTFSTIRTATKPNSRSDLNPEESCKSRVIGFFGRGFYADILAKYLGVDIGFIGLSTGRIFSGRPDEGLYQSGINNKASRKA
jgi:hypothetical protein